MLRNAKPGDRVRLLDGQESTTWSNSDHKVVTSYWPMGAMTGIVDRVVRYSHQLMLVYVVPDHPDGIGITAFYPSQLKRIR